MLNLNNMLLAKTDQLLRNRENRLWLLERYRAILEELKLYPDGLQENILLYERKIEKLNALISINTKILDYRSGKTVIGDSNKLTLRE